MEFTSQEQELLKPFFTNLDKPVFCLKNLPEVVKGALFSRYSRTTKSLRRVLLEEFINTPEMGFKEIVGFQTESGASDVVAIKKAEEFYDRVLVGYGDDSVAELAGAHIACENVSNIATKVIQDGRIGLSPLEKSTRYVYFDEKGDGKYKYYREPAIMQSKFAQTYEETCDLLFDAYSQLITPVGKFVTERFPQEEGVSERAYKSTVRAKVCDLLRGLLPASTLTNTGVYGNGRAFEYLLTKMYASDLAESRVLAASMHEELSKTIPSFVKRANSTYGVQQQEYWRSVRKELRELAKIATGEAAAVESAGKFAEVTLIDYDENAEEKIIAAALYPHTRLPMRELRAEAQKMSAQERTKIIAACVGKRSNRRNKPGRPFEMPYYQFDLLGNYGMYRDLQRHRILTQERQELTVHLGYDLPKELVEAGFESRFRDCMDAAKNAFEQIRAEFPREAQYVVPMAYRVRWHAQMNLREAFHLIELRSMQQGHPDYRRMAQGMFREIKRVHPGLARHMGFVDTRDYPLLERLEAEKKLDKKLEQMAQKYGGAGV